MADKKVTELTAITRVSGDDLLLVVNDPLGTPASRKVTLSNFFANVSVDQVYTAESTFKANTTFSGTTATFSANVMIDGTNILNAVNDRYQVANVDAKFKDSNLLGNTFVNAIRSSNTMFLRMPVAANTPLTTNAASEVQHNNDDQIYEGTMWVGNNHIFVATDHSNIKRARLDHYAASAWFYGTVVGNSAYSFEGGGATGANNETLTLYRGFTYRFTSQNKNHPIYIRNSAGGSDYANGVQRVSGREVYFTVPQNQVANLVYQCNVHSAMVGTLEIR